ncbi:MAG: hypothetical protein K2J73_13400, partial [Oscillospiraceae bacterium]|nr:hypothetical protein [Oscillospiraceae bacterium]
LKAACPGVRLVGHKRSNCGADFGSVRYQPCGGNDPRRTHGGTPQAREVFDITVRTAGVQAV